MHDITDLERRGLPGVFVASDPFVTAAEAQSKALGFNPARLFVEHPIQDRTDAEMHQLADQAVDQLITAISGPAEG